MTDFEPNDELLDDRQIEMILRSIARDERATYPTRDGLRQRMLDEYTATRQSGDDSVSASPSGDDRSTAVELVDLDGDNRLRDRPRRHKSISWVAAAAAVLAVVVVVSEIDGRLPRFGSIEATAVESSLLPAGTETPAPIDAGVHRTEAVVGGISFELPPGLEVLREEPGIVVLGRAGDTASRRATLTITKPNELDSLGDLIEASTVEGWLAPVEGVADTRVGLVSRWELRVTDAGADRFDCVRPGPCVPIGHISAWSSGTTIMVEITSPDGRRVWWVEHAAFHLDPLFRDAEAVLSSLRLE